MAGPTSTVRRVYDALGIEFGDAEANAAADAAAVEREDGVGAHRYHLADFGLDPAEIRLRFERYSNRFLSEG